MPFYDIWEISRKISKDRTSFDFWNNSDIEEIKRYYCENRKEYFVPELITHITKYGYHSDSELDVTYPCYFEDVGKVIKVIKDTIVLDDSFSPSRDKEKQYKNYCIQLDGIKKQVSPGKYKKLFNKIEKMREYVMVERRT